MHCCSWKSPQHTQIQAHTHTIELNRLWNWSCVSVFGWIWIAKENSEYWQKILYPGHTPFMTNASYFNLIRCWQVYLTWHSLRKWSNSSVGVNAGAVWRLWERRLFNCLRLYALQPTVLLNHSDLCNFKSALVMPIQGPPEWRKIYLLIQSCYISCVWYLRKKNVH